MADMYSASLASVVTAPCDVPCWASLGLWESACSFMGQMHYSFSVTDDFGALVPVSVLPADVLVPLH